MCGAGTFRCVERVRAFFGVSFGRGLRSRFNGG